MSNSTKASVPADTQNVALLRLTATRIAAIAGVTLDQIEDVALAVTESCAWLLGFSPAPQEIRLEAEPGATGLTIQLSGPAAGSTQPASDPLRQVVLDALGAQLDADSGSGPRVSLVVGS